jgi:hypothetical protein
VLAEAANNPFGKEQDDEHDEHPINQKVNFLERVLENLGGPLRKG